MIKLQKKNELKLGLSKGLNGSQKSPYMPTLQANENLTCLFCTKIRSALPNFSGF